MSNGERLAQALALKKLMESLDMGRALYPHLFREIFDEELFLRDASLGVDYVRSRQNTLRLALPRHPSKAPLCIAQDASDRALGSVVWDCGDAMAAFLADRPEAVAGRSVVDLGSGTGVAGIASVAYGGADRCLLTDLEECERFSRGSIRQNEPALDGRCAFEALDWRAEALPAGFRGVLAREGCVLLVSDCLYQYGLLRPLLALLRRIVRGDMLLLWSYKMRIREREACYLEMLRQPVAAGGAGMAFFRPAGWRAKDALASDRYDDVFVFASCLPGGAAAARLAAGPWELAGAGDAPPAIGPDGTFEYADLGEEAPA